MDARLLEFCAKLGVDISNIDLSSLKNFLISVCADKQTGNLQYKCEKEYSHRVYYDKTLSILKADNARQFLNGNRPTRKPFDDKQRRLRTMVLDYYFDDYVDDVLLPYLDKNKYSAINRAQLRIAKTMALYPDKASMHHQLMVQKSRDELSVLENIYAQDWKYECDTIKYINNIIRSNEQLSKVEKTGLVRGV